MWWMDSPIFCVMATAREFMFAISKDIHNKKAMPCKYMAKASEDEAQPTL
jgi:hypothetical protein